MAPKSAVMPRRPAQAIEPWPPRGLSRVQSAHYVGISPSKFDEMVKDGRMPKPKRIDSRVVWDRHQLDEAFEALSDDAAGNPLDRILAS